MKRTLLIALAWAAVMIGIAAAGRTGLIPGDNAQTLLIVMPALAVVTIGAVATRSRCGGRA
ncbi:hypothetical protein [Alteriqipengyuania lutimaris]|uniref:Uncharacterized protein n=1 Tax=Alteriqipengyuania lutimaris TaxID=1538146 RepID=A0A395LMZ9_9SPHN|nr:hypothetical protein [Alteriqipengyuania lutimaris]MBB3034218.1 hypothetical protein [Alteriqipengyuania lutimaris]RDS76864.1 hypothetical protein DL238_04075 [Alteriqipengyuania lutimaris]